MQCPFAASICALVRLLPLYMNQQSPEDLASPLQLNDGDMYDFIIVGAGPSGSVLANRLSEETKWKVLLLEAGGEEPIANSIPAFVLSTLNTRLTWNYTTVPDDRICAGEPCVWLTGRGLGGGSLHNNMIFNRGNLLTFDDWERMGNAGWGSEEILSYFKKWENNQDFNIYKNKKYHSTEGLQSVGRFPYVDENAETLLKAFNASGYRNTDFNGANPTGYSLMQYFQKDGERQSSSRAFISPIRKTRSNLKIVTNVRVTKIIINAKSKEAEGVEYVWENNRNQKGKLFARKEVILSTGPMSSPQLLMLSGIGPKEVLEKYQIKVIENLQVGGNLQNHIQSGSIDLVLNSRKTTLRSDIDIKKDLSEYLKSRSGPLASEGALMSAYVSSRYGNSSFPDIQVYFQPATVYNSSNGVKSYNPPISYYNKIIVHAYIVAPKSRGYITINTTDPFSYPLIYPNFFSKEEDMNVVIDGYNFIMNFSKSEILRENGLILDVTPMEKCKQFEFASDDYWRCHVKYNIGSANHFSGTCKMGPSSDKTAVVDPELRVHKVKRLRVVDTSIQPTIVTGNTNSVALTIAEKAADLIKKTWK